MFKFAFFHYLTTFLMSIACLTCAKQDQDPNQSHQWILWEELHWFYTLLFSPRPMDRSKCVTCPTLNLCVLLTCIFFVSPWVSFYVSSHSPVPKLRWRKVDGLMPSKAGLSAEAPTLILPELSFDDEGVYECEAYNSEGSDTHQGRINVQGTVDILWISGGVATEHIPVTITWRQ